VYATVAGTQVVPDYIKINEPMTKPDTTTANEVSVGIYFTIMVSPVNIDPKK
jgi:hypothetical protein